MPFVKRDQQGLIVAVSEGQEPGFGEDLAASSPELEVFLQKLTLPSSIHGTDQDFVRVLEDLVELLVGKGVILFTELPESAQNKVMHRQRLRSKLGSELDLIGDD